MDSKALRLGMACVALLGLAACGGDTRPMIMIDASTGTDSGTTGPVDGGPRDSGGGGGTCGSVAGATGWPDIPATCLPRCQTATLSEAADCGADQACQQAAFDADPTPAAQIDTGATPLEMDCSACVIWQGNGCVYDTCPTEFEALLTCLNTAASEAECATEDAALDACAAVEANGMAIQTCYVGTPSAPGAVYDCFGAGGAAADPGARSPGASRFASLPYVLHYDYALRISR